MAIPKNTNACSQDPAGIKNKIATQIIEIAPKPVKSIFVVLETSVRAPIKGEVNKSTRFEIVNPQHFEILEQIKIFSKAKLIEGENPIGGELIRFDLNNATKSNNNSNQRERLGKEL